MAREGPYLISTVIRVNEFGEEFLTAARVRGHALLAAKRPPLQRTHPAGTIAQGCIVARAPGVRAPLEFGASWARRALGVRSPRPDATFAGVGERGGTTRGMDTKRHAPLGRRRVHLRHSQPHTRSHADLGRTRRPLGDIYVSDHADTRQGGRFRWLREHLPGRGRRRAGHSGRDRRLDRHAGDGRRHAVQPAARARRAARLLPAPLRARRRAALGDPEDRPAADPERGHGDQVRHSRCHAAAAGQPRLHPQQALCAPGGAAWRRSPRRRRRAFRRSTRSSSTPTPRRSTRRSPPRTASRTPRSRSSSCWAARSRARTARSSARRRSPTW